MEKSPNKKKSKKVDEKESQAIITELSEIRQKREKELQEMDRIAKMLVRRDLELFEIREKREKEFQELEKKTRELEETKIVLMNILEDVEESRKKAEEEKNKTNAIITNLTDGLLVFDKRNKLILINPQAENFFKISAEKITGLFFYEFSEFPNLAPLMDLLGKEIKGIFRKELTLGETSVLELSTIPLMVGEDNIGNVVILHDISREKLIEKMKTEFVSLAAHQLRTPLSAIKWTLRLLLDGDLGEITEEQRDFIQKTYQSNERMISLINALLDITRIEEGRYVYKTVFTPIENIIQFVINSCKEDIQRKQIKFQFQKPKEKLPEVRLDVEKIRVAVQNLLDNAICYTPVGGTVELTMKKAKKEIEISIKDSGVGIPKEQQKRVFEKFFRGSNVLSMDTEGTGLGLFITKNIIGAHGGRVWFESEEGKGTTFHFTIPIREKFEEFIKEF